MSPKPQQRRMGAEVPEVVGNLPAVTPGLPTLVLPTSVAEFDGWTGPDVVEWLERAATSFREARLSIGLALWVLRDRMPEAEYSKETDRLAAMFDVDPSSLWRWRKAAQDWKELPDPAGAKRRAEAQKSRREAERVIASRDKREDERPPSTGLRSRSQAAPAQGPDGEPSASHTPTEVLGGAAVSASQEQPAPRLGEDRVCTFVDQLIASGADKAATILGLERARALKVWAVRVEQRAIYKSAEKTATTEKTTRSLERREVTPNFKGTK